MTKTAIVGLLLLVAASTASAQRESPLGTWRLVSYHTETTDGIRTFPLGEEVAGIAMYLPNGRVSIQFMRKNRPLFKSGDAWRGTLDEEKAAFEGFFAYTGRYTIDAASSRVTAPYRGVVGTELRRHRPRAHVQYFGKSPDSPHAAASARRTDIVFDVDLGTHRLDGDQTPDCHAGDERGSELNP
jgi:hypothetical protein